MFSSTESVPLFKINENPSADSSATKGEGSIKFTIKSETHPEGGSTSRPVVKSQTPLRASELMANALVLKGSGEAPLAKALFREVLNLDSKSGVALKNLFEMLPSSLENLDEREKIASARYFHVRDIESIVALAKIKSEQQKPEEAQELYFEAAACDSDRSDLFFEIYKDIGNLHVRSGDYEGAEEYYFKAQAINGLSDILHVNLGTLEVQKGEWSQARERFGQAIALNRSNDKAWVGLALCHHNLEEFELAEASLKTALEFNPLNRTAVHLLASWSAKHKDFSKAISALQVFLSETHHDPEMSLALIHLFCEDKQYDLALLEVERTLLWDPTQKEVIEIEQALRTQVG